MIVKAFGDRGPSDAVRIAMAIRYAVLNGARIIHISAENDQPLDLEQAMIDWATDNGVLVIAAAGSKGAMRPRSRPRGCGACSRWARVIARIAGRNSAVGVGTSTWLLPVSTS